VITAAGFVGQALKIVDGTDDFAGASGEIAEAGQEVGGNAVYRGEVCVQRKKSSRQPCGRRSARLTTRRDERPAGDPD
jgi:hypothetical protein